MFRCELCKHVPEFKHRGPKVLPAGTRSTRVPIKLRATEYPSRPKANKVRIGRKLRLFDDPGGAGYELAKEVLACPTCAREYAAMRAAREALGDYGDLEESESNSPFAELARGDAAD